MDKTHSRYPYTYAADYLRGISETLISRCDASQIRHAIAKAIGIDDEILAKKLADAYIEQEKN